MKVSVIVPVCNVAAQLRQCMESLINQTLQDIEIICIDDFSQDECKTILEEYAQKDSRIINIFHDKNLSTSQARKDGVLTSCGEYVMFVDGDDFLSPNACETAYYAIKNSNTDILQFGVNIINCNGVPEARIQNNQKLVEPCTEQITESNLIRACWGEKKFGFSLWNKIYNGSICRKAFSFVEDGHFPKAQDLYAFFLIAYLSHSSSGICEPLYNYNFGIGITGGGAYLSYDQFKVLLTERDVYEALVRFLSERGELKEYEDILQKIYQHFIVECISKWNNLLKPESAAVGFQDLVDTWGLKDVICQMAEKYWYSRSSVAEKMLNTGYFTKSARPSGKKLTIAAYYRCIHNGGAQRVVASLCNIWADLKDSKGEPLYNVVLITDDSPSAGEYPLNLRVKRAFLPDFETSIKDKYRARFEAWENILGQYHIDIVVSSMWSSPCTLWDMLCVKAHISKPAFVLHSHSFCCIPYRYTGSTALELTYLYQLGDGVVTLSECDRHFISAFSPYTKCIVNPVSFPGILQKSSCQLTEDHVLIWVGRISYEKQPLDAVRMMEYVIKVVPDTRLYMVGDGNPDLMEQIKKLISDLNLEDHIILTGFTQEVEQYYQKARIFIGTSEYEGFSLTFCEAMSYGLPIVTYDIPWLTFIKDGRGIIPVEQKRYDLLAQKVISLLQDEAQCQEIGRLGKQQAIELEKIDVGNEWTIFFNHIWKASNNEKAMRDDAIIYRYISLYQQMAKDSVRSSLQKKLNEAYSQKSELNRKLQITYKEKYERGLEIKKLTKRLNRIEDSITYKIGKAITFIPILFCKGLVRCLAFLVREMEKRVNE